MRTTSEMREAKFRLAADGVHEDPTAKIIAFQGVQFNGVKVHVLLKLVRDQHNAITSFSIVLGYFATQDRERVEPRINVSVSLQQRDNVERSVVVNDFELRADADTKIITGRTIANTVDDGVFRDLIFGDNVTAEISFKVKDNHVGLHAKTDISKSASPGGTAGRDTHTNETCAKRRRETMPEIDAVLNSEQVDEHMDIKSKRGASWLGENAAFGQVEEESVGVRDCSVQTRCNSFIGDPDRLVKELNCKACGMLMVPPIYLCYSGHSICKSCTNRREPNCHSCHDRGIGRKTRNISLEAVANCLYYPCRDCNAMTIPSEKGDHSGQCTSRKIKCPIRGFQLGETSSTPCSWRGNGENILDHLKTEHTQQLGRTIVFGSHHTGLSFKLPERSAYLLVFDDRVFQLSYKYTRSQSYVCVKLFGSKAEASRYKFVITLRSQSGAVDYEVQLSAGMHCDVENESEDCIGLPPAGELRANHCYNNKI